MYVCIEKEGDRDRQTRTRRERQREIHQRFQLYITAKLNEISTEHKTVRKFVVVQSIVFEVKTQN